MSSNAADHLYDLPLTEFTHARDETAAKLKAEGDEETARAVKALKKPTVAAWAANQVARRHPDEVRALLSLRDEIEGASGADLRAAGEKRRHILAQLVRHADAILREGGHGASAGTLEKVTQTFQAGATDEEIELIRSGRLTRELAPSGFAGLGWSDEARWEPPPSKATARATAKSEELTATAEEKEAEARELEKAAEVARKHAEAAARQAEVARRNANRARERAEAAAAQLE